MLGYTAPKPLTGKQQCGKGLGVGGGEWGRENRERLGNEAVGGDGKGQQEPECFSHRVWGYFLDAWNDGAFFQGVFMLMGK